jgi:two-component SAPR family response regulator
LQHRVTSLLAIRGDRLIDAARPQEAFEYFEKALQIDAGRESFYRGLMRVHAARGEQGELLAVYERCRRMLAAEFGCTPSPETEALALRRNF